MDYTSKEDLVEQFFDFVKNATLPSEKNNFRSKFLESNTLLCCVVLLLLLKFATVIIFINIPQNTFFADITKTDLQNSLNQTRQALGLQPLLENAKLDQAAMEKAQNMVANNYFAHTSPTGLTPWYWFLKVGYSYRYAGENLAIGFFDSQEVYNAWMNSSEHRANILNPNYKEVGTAVLPGFGPNNAIVVVQEFGSQLPPKTVTVNNTPENNSPKNITAPIVTPVEPTQTPVTTTPQKVLSQSTESEVVLQPSTNAPSNTMRAIMNSFATKYSGLLQSIIYGMSLVVIGILLTLIFLNLNNDFRGTLVVRSVLIIVLLSLASVINKDIISLIIPYQIKI